MKEYDYQNKPHLEYFLERFKVYLSIANNDLYSLEEQKQFFEKAYLEINEIKKIKDNFVFERDLDNEKSIYNDLCKKYQNECQIKEKKDGEKNKPSLWDEQKFINEVKSAKTKQKINAIYKKIGAIKRIDSWRILLDKTFKINGNINLFIRLLEDNYYPHTDFWSGLSKYLHIGLAVSLKSPQMQKEIYNYLYQNSGYQGFINLMKAYEVNASKNKCILLFKEYLGFCKFLVN
jgi:hypothetical protein